MTTIVTHNGWYHADDVLAVSVLSVLYPNAEIIRTRDEEVIKNSDIAVDVGNEYIPNKNRYDHHQVNPPMRNIERDEKYSAFGLIWKHFGRDYIKHFYKDAIQAKVDFIWSKVNNGFVREIDLNDTGSLNLSVGHLAMMINAQNGITEFKDMFPVVTLFIRGLMNKFEERFDAREIVEKAYEDAKDKRFITLPKSVPWKAFIPDNVLYALYHDDDNDTWKIGTASMPDNAMMPKKALKHEWWGLRDEELSTVSGIQGCVFVHNTGFIGANKTYEGAVEMIIKSME